MDVALGLVLGIGSGLVAGRLYAGQWPLGRTWWRGLRAVGSAGPPAGEEPRKDPRPGPRPELLRLPR